MEQYGFIVYVCPLILKDEKRGRFNVDSVHLSLGYMEWSTPRSLKVDVRSAVTILSLSIKVRVQEYTSLFYPSETLASSDPLSTLKLRWWFGAFRVTWLLVYFCGLG